MLVATRHSAAAHKPVPPDGGGGLLIADECHGLGGATLRRAMLPQYEERLGLTATLERSDDAVTELLIPYFGGICHRYGFEQAIADGVCAAPPRGVRRRGAVGRERAEYTATEQQLVGARNHLRRIRGDAARAVRRLHRRGGAPRRARRRAPTVAPRGEYLDAFSKRRQIVAQSSGKYELLGSLAPAIRDADGALVFTETVRAANHAINRLDPLRVDRPHHRGHRAPRSAGRSSTTSAVRRLDAVAAPRVLDEGIDVPDANLGIVMSASRTRRQMIQRMGRILRRKRAGVAARFVIMFAKDTLEDPAHRIERDGFLDEIERISEATGVFDGSRFDELDAFLAAPGPDPSCRSPSTSSATRDAERRASRRRGRSTRSWPSPPARLLDTNDEAELARLDQPTCRDRPPTSPYLELELADLPRDREAQGEPKRLSTGQAPLEIAQVESGWRISCTGLRRVVTARAVPLAGARPDRRLPLRARVRRRRRGSRRRRG